MPSIPLKHIPICVIVLISTVLVSKKKKYFFFTFLNCLIGKNRYGIGKNVTIFDWEWGRNSAPGEGQKIPCWQIKKCRNFMVM